MNLESDCDQSGQAVVEFTLGFILFFTVFMAVVEFSHLLYTKLTLQHALGLAGRYMITGRTGTDGNGNSIPRDQMIHDVFCANVIATGLACPSLGPNFTFTCPEAAGGICTVPGGTADQTVVLTVNLRKPAMMPFSSQFFPSGGVPFQIGTTWKNEPFVNS